MSSQCNGLLSPFLRRRRIAVARGHLAGRVLDFGCNTGVLTDLVSADRYLGVDIDPTAVAEARHLHPTYRFFQVDELPPEEKFDTVVALAVIEHLPDPAGWAAAMRERLGAGGSVVITTPHSRWEWIHGALSRVRITSREASDEHETTFDQASLRDLFENAGFELAVYKRFLLGVNQLAVARAR